MLTRFFLWAVLFTLLPACTGLHWNSQVYPVRQGETLYAIAWRYNLDYRDLARWNNVSPPYVIHPGQELILIDPVFLPEHRRPQSQPRPDNQPDNSRSLAKTPVKTRPADPVKNSHPSKPILQPPKEWRWPARGKVVRGFKGERSTSQGIDIAGTLGQDVMASAEGRVVYSGSGLSGFGQLIILKHNDTFISAYAHNNILLVKEGEEVRSGQKIAEMGRLHGEPRLHFEIRRQGKPVDPLKYLPMP